MRSLSDWLAYIPLPPSVPDGLEHHVHIVFPADRRPWVLQVKEALQYAGFLVRLDQSSGPFDSPWDSVLDRGLEGSRCSCLVLTPESAGTAWERTEQEALMQAETDNGIPYIPLLLERTVVPQNVTRAVCFSRPECPGGEGLVRLAHALVEQEPEPEAVTFARRVDAELAQALEEIEALGGVSNPEELEALARSDATSWNSFAYLRARIAELLLESGNADVAQRVLDSVAEVHSLSVRARQLRARALLTQGETEEAQRILESLEAEEPDDAESLHLLGRTWFQRYRQTSLPWQRRTARNYYGRGFLADPAQTHLGSRAAVLSCELGERDVARTFLRRLETLDAPTEQRAEVETALRGADGAR